MIVHSWIRKLLGLSPRSVSCHRHPGPRHRLRFAALRLEILEDRLAPANLVVTNTTDADPGSLRAAILASAAGDVITFDPSLAGQTITLTSGELAITHNLTITGLGADRLTVSGNNHSRVFEVFGPRNESPPAVVQISDLTITAGLVMNAINSSEINIGETFDEGGGGIYNDGMLTLSRVAITNSVAQGGAGSPNGLGGGGGGGAGLGGGIFNRGVLTLLSSTVSSNSAVGGNGGSNSGNVEIQGGNGGGINGGLGGFTDDNSGNGGAGGLGGGGGGAAREPAYGIYSGGAGGFGGGGGGGDGSSGSGGGGPGLGGFGGGDGSNGGGGGGAGLGGGVFNVNGGSVTIRNSTIAGNTADFGSGGMGLNSTGGSGQGLGGGVFNQGGGNVVITTSTIASNSAFGRASGTDVGGGFFNQGGTASVRDTILANNTGFDVAGALGSQGHNLIGNTTGGSGFAASDLQNVNPLLQPLGNYGGPTQTMALLRTVTGTSSPALDAGEGDPSTDGPFDQRGLTRVVNGRQDIGAFENQFVYSPPGSQSAVEEMAASLGVGALASPGTYSVTINWGDGTQPTVLANVNLAGAIPAQPHTYGYPGPPGGYTVQVSVADQAGNGGLGTFQVLVSDPPVILTGGLTFTAVQAAAATLQPVATFTDPGGPEPDAFSPGGTINDYYRAAIDWGDGTTPTSGTLSLTGSTFTVWGSHTYHDPGTFAITVTVEQLTPLSDLERQALIGGLYQAYLGRPAGAAEQAQWPRQVADAATVAAAIQRSPEAVQRRVGELYQLLLGRAPDAAGLAGWSGQLLAGATLESVIAGIAGNTPEFANRANQLIGGPDGNANTIVGLYTVLLGRARRRSAPPRSRPGARPWTRWGRRRWRWAWRPRRSSGSGQCVPTTACRRCRSCRTCCTAPPPPSRRSTPGRTPAST